MMGFAIEAHLQTRAGRIVTSGVIFSWLPKAPWSTIAAYGVHIATQREMFINATLAIRISAL